MHVKYQGTLISLICLFFGFASPKEFILDNESDLSREFIHNDCYYSQNFEDFWVWGCDTANIPIVGPPVTAGGFWGACLKSCEIIFNTRIYPQAISIKIEGFISGSSEIQILGTRSSFNLSDWDPIGSIPPSGTWFSETIDTTGFDESFVYKINPTINSAGGLILIDRIVIDVGNEDLPPTTTTTTTTTPKPPAQTGIVSLDVHNDNPKFWHDIACHYSPHFTDFDFAWGCPTNVPVEDDRAGGYWTVCKKESCHMDYYGTILAAPTAIQLSTHIKGDAEIQVFGKRGKLDAADTEQHLYTISVERSEQNSNERFCNRVVLLPISYLFSDIYAITVKLISAENGFVLLDKASVVLSESTLGESPVETSNIVGTVTCKIDISPEPRTTTTTTSTTPSSIGGASGINCSNFFIILMAVMILAIKTVIS